MTINRRKKRKNLDFSSFMNNSRNGIYYQNNNFFKYDKVEDIRKNLDRAFKTNNTKELRNLSRYFFRISGIYARTARYLAYMPTYSYYILPHITGLNVNDSNVKRELTSQLQFLETLKLETILPSIALDVIVDGVSFVYFRRKGNKASLQRLPIDYCRVGTIVNGFPTVEFNLDYFDDLGSYDKKIKAANTLPAEIVYEWTILEENRMRENKNEPLLPSKLLKDNKNDGQWISLDFKKAISFYFNPSLQPLLSNAFFSFLDVIQLKGVEKQKIENTLYNLIVQKFPLNNDDEPIFDMTEIQSYHQGAVNVFKDDPSTSVLSTMADVSNINLNDAHANPIDFEPWEKDIYSDLGVSSQLFSTEGNMALERSIQVDESMIMQLVKQFEQWLDMELKDQFIERTNNESFMFDFNILPITNLNKKDMIKSYQDMATFGYSKMLPAIAAGQKQLQVISMATFENEILNLQQSMVPLQSSNQTSFQQQGNGGSTGGNSGRPKKDVSELSEKTIANINSGDERARKLQ